MRSLIVASPRKNAGKTSVIVGLSGALGGRLGYMKPLGDQLMYRKKRLWDADAALMATLLELPQEAEHLTVGFDHSKLRHLGSRDASVEAVRRGIAAQQQHGERAVLIECGQDLTFGASVSLDPLTLSHELELPTLIIAGGDENEIADDLAFIQRFVTSDEATIAGVIINKVRDLQEFESLQRADISDLGVPVLGVLPREELLTTMTGHFLVDRMFARVVAGEDGLDRPIRHVLVGAMSVDAITAEERLKLENILLITSGDRSDMILTALSTRGTSCVLLSNNIVPPANVLSKADAAGIPLLLVSSDTYQTALKVDRIVPRFSPQDASRIATLVELTQEHIDLDAVRSL
jgi:hypothetical protein